ncbi:MAG: hypothetical protein DME99_11375 [Verrucomicrobia bacterium]|nr:MAG: hypothetical protein DME99_11375 [Verrucomicrobiota bacterium]
MSVKRISQIYQAFHLERSEGARKKWSRPVSSRARPSYASCRGHSGEPGLTRVILVQKIVQKFVIAFASRHC